MIEICYKYKRLKNKIPGLKKLYPELKSMLTEFSKKRENILKIIDDIHFEKDSIKFNHDVEEWKGRLIEHIYTEFKEISDLGNKIKLLQKCDKLKLEGLELGQEFTSSFQNLIACKYYSNDIIFVYYSITQLFT